MKKDTTTTHIMLPKSIEDITFKYLFDDKESEDHKKYFHYFLVNDSLVYPNQNIVLFKVESKDKQETYEMKLISKNDMLYVMSDFLDEECLEYELERFDGSKSIILYKKFHDGELYIHIDLEE